MLAIYILSQHRQVEKSQPDYTYQLYSGSRFEQSIAEGNHYTDNGNGTYFCTQNQQQHYYYNYYCILPLHENLCVTLNKAPNQIFPACCYTAHISVIDALRTIETDFYHRIKKTKFTSFKLQTACDFYKLLHTHKIYFHGKVNRTTQRTKCIAVVQTTLFC